MPAPRQKPIIPYGSWPRRMTAAMAAGYVGEERVGDFLKRVGTEYPKPRIDEGKRQLWLKDDLDRAIGDPEMMWEDAADVL